VGLRIWNIQERTPSEKRQNSLRLAAMRDMLKRFRGYYHFIKKQQKHRDAFGVHPIRAVIVETTDEARGKKLMELAGHPLVTGPVNGLDFFGLASLPSSLTPLAQPRAF